MNSFVVTSFLAGATFLQSLTRALAKQCSYDHYGDITYYTCLNNQKCCGRSSCCFSTDYYYSVYDLWYFWFCLCFGIFICSLTSGAYYRKRQLRGVQVPAIHAGNQPGAHRRNTVQVMHGHGAMVGRMGPDGLMHPHPRNVMVTTTDASGQPVYPPQPYFDGPAPNYATYGPSGPCGPVYPAYAYLPPPPSYSSLGTEPTLTSSAVTSTTSSPSSSLTSSTGSRPEVPPVSA